MGNCYYFLKLYDESFGAFVKAAALSYKKLHNAYYNAACAASLTMRKEAAIYYLKLALMSGYEPVESLDKDPDLNYVRQFPEYQALKEKKGLDSFLEASTLSSFEPGTFGGDRDYDRWYDKTETGGQRGNQYEFYEDGRFVYSPGSAAEGEDAIPFAGMFSVVDGLLILDVCEYGGKAFPCFKWRP